MKQILRMTAMCFLLGMTTSGFSQIGIAAGLGLSFGSEASTVGLHLRGDVDVDEIWGGSFNFITYFSPDFGVDYSGIDNVKAKYSEVNFDGHYFVPVSEDLTVYPLAGLNLSTAGVKTDFNVPFVGNVSETETKVGLNLGGGVRFAVAEQISVVGELKYILSDFDQLVISAAGLYHF